MLHALALRCELICEIVFNLYNQTLAFWTASKCGFFVSNETIISCTWNFRFSTLPESYRNTKSLTRLAKTTTAIYSPPIRKWITCTDRSHDTPTLTHTLVVQGPIVKSPALLTRGNKKVGTKYSRQARQDGLGQTRTSMSIICLHLRLWKATTLPASQVRFFQVLFHGELYFIDNWQRRVSVPPGAKLGRPVLCWTGCTTSVRLDGCHYTYWVVTVVGLLFGQPFIFL